MKNSNFQIPVLSIVMPIYNNAELAVKMISSIRDNDFEDWELLAVDDGSDDENFKIIDGYCVDDDRIHYFRRDRDPKGAQTCRNMGFEKARGEYIIFFDSDDYVTPTCLGNRVKAISRRPELDFMVFPSGVVKNDVFNDLENEFAYGYDVFDDDCDAFARRILPFVVWNNIYRKESLRRANIVWDVRLLSLQDADFNIQTIFAGLEYDYSVARADIGYRIDAGSGSVSKKATSVEHQKSTIYAIEKFYKLYCSKYGSKYNSSLYHGVLFLFNWMMSEGIVTDFAYEMCAVVSRYSAFYGFVLKMQVMSTKILQIVIKRKTARQIPMALHLMDYRKRIRNKIIAIKNIIGR